MQTTATLPNLLDTIHPEILARLAPVQQNAIQVIDCEDFTQVKKQVIKDLRKQGKEPSDDFLARGILALKQYYLLPVLDPKNYHAVSDTLDAFWHAHIIFTDDYSRMWNDAVGCYMPHKPLDHDNTPRVSTIAEAYEFSCQRLKEIFSYLDPEFFPMTVAEKDLVCNHGGADVREYLTTPFALFPQNDRIVNLMLATA